MSRHLLPTLFALILFSLAAPSLAQDEPAAPAPTETAEATPKPKKVDPELVLRLGTPRRCFESFRAALDGDQWDVKWDVAVSCLDFGNFPSPAEVKSSNGRLLAYRLNQILSAVFIDGLMPDDEDFEGQCVLSEYARDQQQGPLDGWQKNSFDMIAISRSEVDGLWRFDPGTVTQIEALYEKWQPELKRSAEFNDSPKPTAVWLAEQFPESLHSTHFLIADYIWILLAGVVALGFLADALVGFLAINVSQHLFGIVRTDEKDAAVRQLWKPFGLLLQALVWYYGTSQIGIPTWTTNYLSTGLRFFAVFAGIWVFFRLIDFVSDYLARRASATASKFDDLLIPLITTIAKVLSTVVGLLICAETFSLNVNTLLGGLGIGGMALALASKDAVSNLFGSFTVLIDRPFEIGDWVITEDVEGTVEMVGFRSTRIRTFYNSVVTLPNSRLTTAIVDNMGRRRYRRVKTTLGLQYRTTPEQMDAFCEGIRELIRRNPSTRKDYFHVYFNGFNDSSLDVMLYFFLRVPDWATELREKHKLFLEILQLAQELNVDFAFPTRTLHMHPETEPPAPHALDSDDAELFGRESAARIAERAGIGSRRHHS